MKKLLFALSSLIILGSSAFATSYLKGWRVYAGGVNNATVTESGNKIILKGKGIKSGYILGAVNGTDAWHNKRERLLSVSLMNSDLFTLYVPVNTTNGLRYLTYTTHPNHINKRGKEGSFIYLELDEDEQTVGKEKTVERNLDADLKRYEPNNEIIEVNALMLRGDSEVFGVKLRDIHNRSSQEGTVYEDGTNYYKWRVYAGGKSNGKIKDAYHGFLLGDVLNPMVSFAGDGIKSAYILGGIDDDNAWNNKTQTQIKWSMFDVGIYTVYVPIKTAQGIRYMTYTTHPDHRDKRGKEGTLIYMGTKGAIMSNNGVTGEVVRFTKNLRQDLAKYEPNNTLLAVNGFMVRGSCLIDNIVLQKEESASSAFDLNKFNQLLEIEKTNLESMFVKVELNHSKENIAWFTYEVEDGQNYSMRLYTLDKDNKELSSLYEGSLNCYIDSDVKFLENNTRMLLTVDIDNVTCGSSVQEHLYNLEQHSIFRTEYSFLPSLH